MVEKINTAFKPSYRDGKPAGGFYAEQASGDFRAVAPGGYSVLVEVKRRELDRLSLSDFEPHQLQALTDHNRLGGLSLVTWVTSTQELILMRWPMPIIAHRRRLRIDEAREIGAMTKVTLSLCLGEPWTVDRYGELAEH